MISPNQIATAKSNNLEFVGLCDTDRKKLYNKVVKFDLQNIHQYVDYYEMIEQKKLNLLLLH